MRHTLSESPGLAETRLVCVGLFVGAALLVLGCQREPELYSGKASKASSPQSGVPPAKPQVAPQPPASRPRAVLKAPDKVEVEMSGKVEIPPRLRTKRIKIYVAEQDCLDEKSKVFGVVAAGKDGKFFVEVFAPTGSYLSLCVAVDDGEGNASRAYGALPRKLRAVGTGEVVFPSLAIELKVGPPHLFRSRP